MKAGVVKRRMMVSSDALCSLGLPTDEAFGASDDFCIKPVSASSQASSQLLGLSEDFTNA